jgi:hypothetical protein
MTFDLMSFIEYVTAAIFAGVAALTIMVSKMKELERHKRDNIIFWLFVGLALEVVAHLVIAFIIGETADIMGAALMVVLLSVAGLFAVRQQRMVRRFEKD